MNVRSSEKIQDKLLLFERFVTSIVGCNKPVSKIKINLISSDKMKSALFKIDREE